MKITDSTSSMILDDNAIPSNDDMNAIMSHVVTEHLEASDEKRGIIRAGDDDLIEDQRRTSDQMFIALCAAVQVVEGMTNGQFKAACEAWISKRA